MQADSLSSELPGKTNNSKILKKTNQRVSRATDKGRGAGARWRNWLGIGHGVHAGWQNVPGWSRR